LLRAGQSASLAPGPGFRYDARLVGLDAGNPTIVPADPPRARQRQLPLDNDIIAFSLTGQAPHRPGKRAT
jgi:hypothetical protein